MSGGPRLHLPQVTLCAVTSVNLRPTLRALEASLDHVTFGACILLTDARITARPDIDVVPIARVQSSADYSTFILKRLAEHLTTTHCLIVQWDGHVLNATKWRGEFLDYDYIGARWPQFNDGHDVGNGGFSLRSRRLLEACGDAQFQCSHPEDMAIGRINREWLESRGMRFAPPHLADAFATERTGNLRQSFGYHGVFNMPEALGADAFWQVYTELDDTRTIRRDFGKILSAVARSRNGLRRAGRMVVNHLTASARGGNRSVKVDWRR